MSRMFKLMGVALAVVALVAFGLVSAAFAAGPQATGVAANIYAESQGYGEPGNCTGPGDMHQWGRQAGEGVGYGEPSDGTGPGDLHRWGQEAGNGTCLRYTGLCTGPGQMHQYGEQAGNGASWGEPSDGTGPGDMHQWGRG